MDPISHNEYMMRYYRTVYAFRVGAFGAAHWATVKVEEMARARASRIIGGLV